MSVSQPSKTVRKYRNECLYAPSAVECSLYAPSLSETSADYLKHLSGKISAKPGSLELKKLNSVLSQS